MSDIDFSQLMNSHSDADSNEQSNDKSQVASPLNNHKNPYLADPNKGMSLCASLIASEQKMGEAYTLQQKLTKLIENDFLQHAEEGDNTIQAKTYVELQHWLVQVAEAIYFPQLEQSHTIAVGGSFSAGKTHFLNTVLGCPSLLPTDTTPTTSIPTYLFQGQSDSIDALNFYGKKTAIDEDALKAISHAFNEQYQVTFSHILQMIAVERQNFKYANLIFLDTPGYSKADNVQNSEDNTDENLARNHLRTADYLIWLVDHQNGTVPQHDIEFIQSLELAQPILVIMSKADKKPESEIKKIISGAKQDLDRAEIAYIDVIGYSAQLDKEISTTGHCLRGFLDDINQASLGSTLQWRLQKIFADYLNFYDSNYQSLRLTNSTINELIFDEKISDDKKVHLNAFQQKTKAQLDAIHQQHKQAKDILNELLASLQTLSQALGINLCEIPDLVQVKAMKQKNKAHEQEEAYQFDAILQGDLTLVANLPKLHDLKGSIIKTSAIGVFISLDAAPELEVLIHKFHIKRHAPALDYQRIETGMSIEAQITDQKKCQISLTLHE